MTPRVIAAVRASAVAVAIALCAGGLALPASAAPAPLVTRTATTPPAWPSTFGSTGFFAATCAGLPATPRCATRGAVVSEAQRRLLARKYTGFGVKVTGVFDYATGRAIKKFKADQAARGNDIGSTPRIGIKTYKALLTAPLTAPAPSAPSGSAACTSVNYRTCKATTLTAVSLARRSIRGFCPVVGATLGDGWGAGRNHQGIDLLITRSQYLGNRPVYSVEGGVVLKSHRQANGALVVQIVGTSGAGYYYGHQKVNLVKAGQRVKAGQVIGYVGDTGSPGAWHLHFQFHPTIYVSSAGNRWLGPPSSLATSLIRSLCF